jgi:hypothetical protein
MTIPVPPTDPLDDQLLLAAVRADLSGDDDYFRWFLRLAHADGRRTLTATFGAVQITSRLAPGPEAV